MIQLTEKVIKLIKKKKSGIKLETLIDTLQLKPKEIEVLKLILEKLEMDGKIYLNDSNHYIPFSKEDNLVISKLRFSPKKNPYILIEEKVVFIPKENLKGAKEEDFILVRKGIGKQIKEDDIEVEKVLNRLNHLMIFDCVGSPNGKKIRPCNIPFQIPVSISNEDWNSLNIGDRFSLHISSINSNGTFHGEIITKIGNKKDSYLSIKTVAASYGIRICFPKKVEEEAKRIPTSISEQEMKREIENGRISLKDKLIFTIDSKYAEDLDDAISLEINDRGNYVLGIYISDVSYYVKEGSAIQQEALKRGSNCYFYNCVIPMLPKSISNGICSLSPNVDRFARAIEIELTPNGDIINYKRFKCIICSKKKMTYEDLNTIFDDHKRIEGYEKYLSTLKKMHQLSAILNQKKQERGYIYFEKKKLHIFINENSKPILVGAKKRGSFEQVIENFMLLANELEADYQTNMQISNSSLSFIYRTQNIPNLLKIEEAIDYLRKNGFVIEKNDYHNPKNFQSLLKSFSKFPSFPAISTILSSGLSNAQYSLHNTGHYGLALNGYTHCTSPIRRYIDLQTQYNMDKFTKDWLPADRTKEKEKMITICENSTQSDKRWEAAKNEIEAYQLALYMKENIGEGFHVLIMSIDKYQVTVRTNLGVIGLIPTADLLQQGYELKKEETILVNKNTKDKLKFGNYIPVILTEVDLKTKKMIFSLSTASENIVEAQKEKVYTKEIPSHIHFS